MAERNWTPFNLNERVRVKLTVYGRIVHKQNHVEFWRDVRARLAPDAPEPSEYRAPKEDAEGWSEWQTWELFHEFGDTLWMGNDNPFDLTIEFDMPREAKVDA